MSEPALEMSPLLAGLNEQQRAAVLASTGPVLILAGAGSGKTRVITHRIAHLVLERQVPSERILAVTFTNKAAAEMQARTAALLGGRELRTWISTFHSLCVRLLRREHEAAGLAREFVIFDEDDQLQAVREALRRLDLSEKLHPPRRVLARLSAAKNRRETAARAGADEPTGDAPDSPAAALDAHLGRTYQQILDAARALDFDDLLLRTVDLLERRADVREAYRRRFEYVLVDEYQDTNRAQYQLVRHLVGAAGNVTVVGDEDQSIYSWRGADIQNILDFEADYPGARVLRLEQNYRSTQAILDAAAGVVAHNVERKGKRLHAVQRGGERVRLHQAADEYHEAAYVVSELAARRRAGSVAVLYRMNAQSRPVEEQLLRQRIAYQVVGGVGFYERKEVRDALAYLRLVHNPDDPMALKRVLNVPARGIGERTLQELERLAAERHVSLWQALQTALAESRLPGRALLPLQRFHDLIVSLRGEREQLSLKDLLARALERSGYSTALAQDEGHESQDRLANLAELLSAAADYESRQAEPSLGGFLDRVSLLADTDQLRDDSPVVLMTLHSAKGLEFKTVFLMGLEEGLLPHARSLAQQRGLEEERRLCYVGMTRAMERLYLTWTRARLVFGQRRPAEPSRFLSELPPACVELTGALAGTGGGAARDRRGASLFEPRRSTTADLPAAQQPPADTAAVDLAAFKPGLRVRHPLFGVGTIVRKEATGDDVKLTVAFPGAGLKRLMARYAGLEPA